MQDRERRRSRGQAPLRLRGVRTDWIDAILIGNDRSNVEQQAAGTLLPFWVRAFVRARGVGLVLASLVIGVVSGSLVALMGWIVQELHVLLFGLPDGHRLSGSDMLSSWRVIGRSDPGRGHSRDVGPLCATVFWTTCGCDRSQCAVRGQALPEGQPAADRADDRVLRLRCVRRHGSGICPDLGRDRLAARPVACGAPRRPSPACRLRGRRRDSRSFRGAARRCLLRLRGGAGHLYGQRSRPGRHQRADGQPR